MTEPTDAEIDEIYRSTFLAMPNVARQPPQTVPPMVRDFARAVLAKWGAPAPMDAEPVALLVRKNSWRDGQWEAAPPNSPSYGLAWANQRVYVYTTPQPTQAQAGAVPLTDKRMAKRTVTFTGETGKVTLHLNDHHIEQMLLVCADGIIESAKAAARMFVQEALAGTEAAKQRQLASTTVQDIAARLQEPKP